MISPSGQLTTQRLGRILTDLLNHRYIGVLGAEDSESAKEFYFAGSGVKVTSVGPRKSLPAGRFWIAAGAVSEETLEATLRLQEDRGGLIGELLVDGGLMTDEARNQGLEDQLVEELCDLFFWPSPKYRYSPGHQTRVGATDRLRERAGAKSLSIKTNLAQAIMRARVEGLNLKTAGRNLGGVEPEYKGTPALRDVLFTKETFMTFPPAQRKLLPLFTKPRSAGQLIEGAGIPWSIVLKGMGEFLEKKIIERA